MNYENSSRAMLSRMSASRNPMANPRLNAATKRSFLLQKNSAHQSVMTGSLRLIGGRSLIGASDVGAMNNGINRSRH